MKIKSCLLLVTMGSFVGCSTIPKEPGLVFHCTFDDAQSVLSPVVGPSGCTNGATFVNGKFEKALHVPAHVAVAEFSFPNGLPRDACTIDFWAKIEGNREWFRDGVDPYLFIVTKNVKGWPIVFECNFNANNGCGQSGFFCGMSYGRAVNVPVPGNRFAALLGSQDPHGWHRYTIEWSQKGIDDNGNTVRVSIDGKEIGRGIRSPKDVKDFFAGISGSVNLVFSNPKSGHGRSAVAIDDFKILSIIRER